MAHNVGLGAEGPVERGWALWLTSVLAVVIASLFVTARLVQRLYRKVGLGMDDYMIIVALVSSGLLSLTECQAVVYGYGRHWKTLPHDPRILARKWFYAANIMYKVVLLFNKISVVCLYYRIFGVTSKSFRMACHVMNVWIITSGLAFCIATVFQCTPVAAFWDRTIVGFKCFKNEPWWISYATTQITTDFVLLAMPIGQICKLSMGRAEKLGISLVFGTGIFVTFASIYRATTIARSAHDPDPTWGPIPATIWSVIEANTGIICACLPMLRGPFVRLFEPLLVSRGPSKPTSCRLSKRMGCRRVGAAHAQFKHGTDFSNATSEFDGDSELGMIKDESLFEERRRIQGRRGSGIFVVNEISVVSGEVERPKPAAQRDGQAGHGEAVAAVAAQDLNDKTEQEKPRAFYHV